MPSEVWLDELQSKVRVDGERLPWKVVMFYYLVVFFLLFVFSKNGETSSF
jgi:hypothetical protein